MSSGPAPPVDLSPAGLAAQARELAAYAGLGDRLRVVLTLEAALTAVRDAGRAEAQAYLASCPWCGEDMKGRTVARQMAHILSHGNQRAEEVRQLREALAAICNELGEPQVGYPAPVTNAVVRARRALAATAEAES